MNKSISKFMVLLITFMLMTCVIVGCGGEASQSETRVTEEKTSEVEATTEMKEDAVTEEDATVDNSEEVTEEPAQPEELEVVEDPGEVTYITDFANIHTYAETLDPYEPDILVYNKEEHYIINMQEGQHYQLKGNDQIVFYNPDKNKDPNIPGGDILCGWDFDLGGDTLVIGDCEFMQIDYSKMEQNQKFFFSKRNENDEKIVRTCYFDPPME